MNALDREISAIHEQNDSNIHDSNCKNTISFSIFATQEEEKGLNENVSALFGGLIGSENATKLDSNMRNTINEKLENIQNDLRSVLQHDYQSRANEKNNKNSNNVLYQRKTILQNINQNYYFLVYLKIIKHKRGVQNNKQNQKKVTKTILLENNSSIENENEMKMIPMQVLT